MVPWISMNQNGTVDSTHLANSTSSDFLFKRIIKSIAYTIAGKATEADVPDRSIGSFISYLISPFALLCMAMAVVLNRTVVFATTRRPTTLPFVYRVLLRSVALYSLVPLFLALTKTLKSTSPNGLGAFLPDSLAMGPGDKPLTPAVLWKLYRAICIGHFIETFSSVIQGKIPYSETGMTLFEYSVAFQEVQVFQKLSEEVLVVSLLSILGQMVLHIQGMFNSYRYRLIPSSILGVSFLSYFAWSLYQGRVLYFPSVCVIGYLPQLAISGTIVICAFIYGLACIFAGGPNNMQTSLKAFRVSMSEDFYSCLLKLGMLALTSVSKATYLSESTALSAPLITWIEQSNRDVSSSSDSSSRRVSISPYQNEVSISDVGGGRSQDYHERARARARTGGFVMVNRFMTAVQMVQSLVNVMFLIVWRGIGSFVQRLLFRPPSYPQAAGTQTFEQALEVLRSQVIYANLDGELEGGYLRLLSGDLIPDIDDSVDYVPDDDLDDDDDDDIVFGDDDEDEADADADYDDHDYYKKREPVGNDENGEDGLEVQERTGSTDLLPSRVKELYDLMLSSPDYLMSLLAPQTPDEAEEAKILSTHLARERSNLASSSASSSTRPLTRAKYHELVGDEKREMLKVISERRKHPLPEDAAAQVRESVCVVCQAAPRQVVLWPCRCFALCEECRLELALKKFKGCVCCRRNVDSFSRIFVP